MVSSQQYAEARDSAPIEGFVEVERWYALQTRARHEKVVRERLEQRGIATFLPTVIEVHRWSDRKKQIELPLFSCYLFARLVATKMNRLRMLCLEGVCSFVGCRGEGVPIPDDQIEAVRTLICSRVPCSSYPFLKTGQRVRICSGSLQGIEGMLVSRDGDSTLVISVDGIQRSLAVRVDGYKIEPA
jgi:transcription antitermination factor NusG